MQYTFGILGIGVKFEKEEFHAHVKRGMEKTKKAVNTVVEQAKPTAVVAADSGLKYTIKGIKALADVMCDGADKLHDLRSKLVK